MPAITNKRESIRLTIDVTKAFYERLNGLEKKIADHGGPTGKANIIRQALQLYEFVVNHTIEGGGFKTVSKTGKEEGLVILGPPPTSST